jgi:hypothetical protein
MILNKEQVDALTYEQCKSALEKLFETYDMEKPAITFTKEEWASCDDVCNTYLYLQDRIARFEDPRIPSMDPESDTARPMIPPPQTSSVPKQVRRRRKFRVDNVIYDSVMDASQRLGLKEHTLRNYVSRDPKKYGYLD